jgi:geranylgeranyl diphosphate synthase, type II
VAERARIAEIASFEGPREAPRKLLARLERRLAEHLAPPRGAAESPVERATRTAVLASRRRARARLVLAVAQACDAREFDLALDVACAIELVHHALRVHDDLPALADIGVRRGELTLHVRCGEALALLAGQQLLARAFAVVAAAPGAAAGAARLCLVVARAARRDADEALVEALRRLIPGVIDRSHAVATAHLFGLAAEAGAIAAGVADTAAWGEVGQHLGVCYQATRGEPCLDEARARIPLLATDPHRVLGLLAEVEPFLDWGG